jgi:hypothetical protein
MEADPAIPSLAISRASSIECAPNRNTALHSCSLRDLSLLQLLWACMGVSSNIHSEKRLNSESVHECVQLAPPSLLPGRLPAGRLGEASRAPRLRVHLLGAVRGYALLPTWAGLLPPGDLWGLATWCATLFDRAIFHQTRKDP